MVRFKYMLIILNILLLVRSDIYAQIEINAPNQVDNSIQIEKLNGLRYWQNRSFRPQKGNFTIVYDVIAPGKESYCSTVLSYGAINRNYTPFPANTSQSEHRPVISIIFNSDGLFLASNGEEKKAVNDVYYEPEKMYHIRITVDVPARRYSAFVVDEAAVERTIALNYQFAPTSLRYEYIGNFAMRSLVGSHTIKNVRITASDEHALDYLEDVAKIQNRLKLFLSGQFGSTLKHTSDLQAVELELQHYAQEIMKNRKRGVLPNTENTEIPERISKYFHEVYVIAQAYNITVQNDSANEQLRQRVIDDLVLGQQWLRPGTPSEHNQWIWQVDIPSLLLRISSLMENHINESLTTKIRNKAKALTTLENNIKHHPNNYANQLLLSLFNKDNEAINTSINNLTGWLTPRPNGSHLSKIASTMIYQHWGDAAFICYLVDGTIYELPPDKTAVLFDTLLKHARYLAAEEASLKSDTHHHKKQNRNIKYLLEALILLGQIENTNQTQLLECIHDLLSTHTESLPYEYAVLSQVLLSKDSKITNRFTEDK